ncbi:cupin domain-containing protein [uncultured Dubosiella sp.]|uniref:cupin domain-containing protein n=2 Tax=uncultured Dubosiella sp. TaxID=1937011 RepID=UPI002595AEB8|nr:cupin domain-containing protein [uncultured Dubosiella sp.]
MTQAWKAGEVFALHDQISYEKGKAVKKVVEEGTAMKLILVAIEESELPTHAAPMNALVTVLDGKGTLTYLGKQYTLHKGDSFIFNKGDQHAVKADKKIKFSLLLWEPAQ